MCLICVEFQKQKMNIRDAKKALGEMSEDLEPEHVQEVEVMIEEAEQEREEAEDEQDKQD